MSSHLYPAVATCIALFVYMWTFIRCGSARGRYNIKAPAITGHPLFERNFRVQQNTIEQLVLFLPSLWLFSLSVSQFWGGLLGLVWAVGRVLYGLAYVKDPEKRGLGFGISAVATLILLVGAFIKIVFWMLGAQI